MKRTIASPLLLDEIGKTSPVDALSPDKSLSTIGRSPTSPHAASYLELLETSLNKAGSPELKALAADIRNFTEFRPDGSGSGAEFYQFHTSQGIEYLMKVGSANVMRGEIDTFRKMSHLAEDHPVRKSHLEPVFSLEPAADRVGIIVMRKLDAHTTFDEMLAKDADPEFFNLIFKQGIGMFIQSFWEHQVPCENPREWFFEKTVDNVLNPLTDLLRRTGTEFQANASAEMTQDQVMLNGVKLPNCLDFLAALKGIKVGAGISATTIEIIRKILYIRFLVDIETTSDPNLFNEMVSTVNGEPRVTFIDPGRLEPRKQVQVAAVLVKHDGPFALMLPFVLKKWARLTETGDLDFGPHQANFEKFKHIHDVLSMMNRYQGLEAGAQLMAQRPFFMIHLLFYSIRQFLRDAPYAETTNDLNRLKIDFRLGCLGMAAMERILITIAKGIKTNFPDTLIDDVFADPSNFDCLNKIGIDAYKAFSESEDAIATLFRTIFCKAATDSSRLPKCDA